MTSLFTALFLAILPVSSFASALGNQLQDIKEAYSWTCTGSACYELVNEQIKVLNTLKSFWDNLDPSYPVDTLEGSLAKKAAIKICRSYYTDMDTNYLLALTNAENRAMLRLKEIQRRGAVEKPRVCRKVIK